MDLQELDKILLEKEATLSADKRYELAEYIKKQPGVYPFNPYEHRLFALYNSGVLEFEEYVELREKYIENNKYLGLFSFAPRTFGETWIQDHVQSLDNRFIKPSKKHDPEFQGEYDLLLDGIKVEVKACRAINTKIKGDMSAKALRTTSTSPFWMNFQQLKVDMCDAFLFIGVWVDEIKYWVLTPEEVKKNPYYSPQHRGGIEYQIGIKENNIQEFKEYEVEAIWVGEAIVEKCKGR